VALADTYLEVTAILVYRATVPNAFAESTNVKAN
jgi:hypothetical protein